MGLIKYQTRKFSDIYSSAADFQGEFTAIYNLIDANNYFPITQAQQSQLFYLLYGQYGNSPIANQDEMQFKIKLFSYVYQYAPRYFKEMEINHELLSLTEDEMAEGAKSIFNHAYNPGGTTPNTTDMDGFDYINDQNVTNFQKGKIDRYMNYLEILKDSYTKRFLDKFKDLFSLFVGDQHPIIFESEEYE